MSKDKIELFEGAVALNSFGESYGPMKINEDSQYKFKCERNSTSFTENGVFSIGYPSGYDLIKLIGPAPAQPLPSPGDSHEPRSEPQGIPPETTRTFAYGPTGSAPSIRSQILSEADRITSGEREEAYGGPEDSFRAIAAYWQVFLNNREPPKDRRFEGPGPLAPHEVALLMALLKLARLQASPDHWDSWVDLAGYAACGAECARVEPKETK